MLALSGLVAWLCGLRVRRWHAFPVFCMRAVVWLPASTLFPMRGRCGLPGVGFAHRQDAGRIVAVRWLTMVRFWPYCAQDAAELDGGQPAPPALLLWRAPGGLQRAQAGHAVSVRHPARLPSKDSHTLQHDCLLFLFCLSTPCSLATTCKAVRVQPPESGPAVRQSSIALFDLLSSELLIKWWLSTVHWQCVQVLGRPGAPEV